jgi:hypothetical protein
MNISNGRVTISNTASPALDVIASSGVQSTIRVLGNATVNGLELYNNSSEQGLSNSNALPFYLWTSNVRRLTVLSNGSVGIGTVSPATFVDISYSAANNYVNIRGADGFQQALSFTDSAQRWIIYKPANTTALRFNDATTDRVTFLNGGNVGIGTTNPQTLLDVVRPGTGVQSAVRIYAGEGGGSVVTNTAMLRFAVKGGGGGDVSSDFILNFDGGNYGISVRDSQATSVPYVRFDSTNRRLGVGTVSPRSPLDVSGMTGTANSLARFYGSAFPSAVSIQNDVGEALLSIAYSAGDFYASANSGDFVLRGNTSNKRVHIVSTTNGSTWNGLTVNSNGSVGIGTSAPGSILDISGSAGSSILYQGDTNTRIDAAGAPGQDSVSQISIKTRTSATSTFPGILRVGIDISSTNNLYGVAFLQAIVPTIIPLPLSLNPRGGNVGIGTSAPRSGIL